MQIIIYILGAISGYLLWGKVTWLSIVVIVLTLSYSVHPGEQKHFNENGSYDKTTATRLGLTFALVFIIFIYALFLKIKTNDVSTKQVSSFDNDFNYVEPVINRSQFNAPQKLEVSEKNIDQNNEDCNKRAMAFSEKFKQVTQENRKYINYFVLPKFHFNTEMNACLSENGFVFPDHGGEGTYLQIVNIDNNSFVLRSSQNAFGNDINPNNGIVSYDDFLLQEKDIMIK